MNCFYCKEDLTITDIAALCKNIKCLQGIPMSICKNGKYHIPLFMDRKLIGSIQCNEGNNDDGLRVAIRFIVKSDSSSFGFHKDPWPLPFDETFNDRFQCLMHDACKLYNSPYSQRMINKVHPI